jgi:hypothetical protein
MDTMNDEVQKPEDLIVRQVPLAVENKPVEEVLGEGEREGTQQEEGEEQEQVASFPVHLQKVVANHKEGQHQNGVPFYMR